MSDGPGARARVRLGASGVEISPIGIGTWAWGNRTIWGYGRGYGETDLRSAFDFCAGEGLNFFDTAEVYGRGLSERLLGRFIGSIGKPGMMVATKFMPFPWRLRGNSLLKALRRSLDRLGLNSVDLYQVHWPSPPISVETWMNAMADAVAAGLTTSVGVSNYGPSQMQRAREALARRGIELASNQVQFNLLSRSPERNGLLAACLASGVALIAYSPLAMGVLTGKYTPDRPPPGFRGRRYRPSRLIRIRPLIDKMREIGERHSGRTPAQVAINWCICKGAVPIPGVKNLLQAREDVGALGWRLSEKELEELDTLSDSVR